MLYYLTTLSCFQLTKGRNICNEAICFFVANSCNKCTDVCVQKASCLYKIVDCFYGILWFLLYKFSIVQGKGFNFFRTYICFLTSSFWFSICVLNVKPFIEFIYDIPDIEGDKKFGIRSFATRLGKKKVWFSIATS